MVTLISVILILLHDHYTPNVVDGGGAFAGSGLIITLYDAFMLDRARVSLVLEGNIVFCKQFLSCIS